MGPTSKKNDEKQKGIRKYQNGIKREIERIFFKFFFHLRFFLRFTKTCPFEFVGINTESALRDEGYA